MCVHVVSGEESGWREVCVNKCACILSWKISAFIVLSGFYPFFQDLLQNLHILHEDWLKHQKFPVNAPVLVSVS